MEFLGRNNKIELFVGWAGSNKWGDETLTHICLKTQRIQEIFEIKTIESTQGWGIVPLSSRSGKNSVALNVHNLKKMKVFVFNGEEKTEVPLTLFKKNNNSERTYCLILRCKYNSLYGKITRLSETLRQSRGVQGPRIVRTKELSQEDLKTHAGKKYRLAMTVFGQYARLFNYSLSMLISNFFEEWDLESSIKSPEERATQVEKAFCELDVKTLVKLKKLGDTVREQQIQEYNDLLKSVICSESNGSDQNSYEKKRDCWIRLQQIPHLFDSNNLQKVVQHEGKEWLKQLTEHMLWVNKKCLAQAKINKKFFEKSKKHYQTKFVEAMYNWSQQKKPIPNTREIYGIGRGYELDEQLHQWLFQRFTIIFYVFEESYLLATAFELLNDNQPALQKSRICPQDVEGVFLKHYKNDVFSWGVDRNKLEEMEQNATKERNFERLQSIWLAEASRCLSQSRGGVQLFFQRLFACYFRNNTIPKENLAFLKIFRIITNNFVYTLKTKEEKIGA